MASESAKVIARGQLSFIDITIPNKDSIRSRWIEINGTDSVTQTSNKGSYYTIKTLVAKYADIAGRCVLAFDGYALTFNGDVLTFPSIGTAELDSYYIILRNFLADAGLSDTAEEFEHFDWDTYSKHLTNYEDAETRLNDLIYQALQRYSSETRENYESFRSVINATIEEMQDVLDNTIETWFYDPDPPTLSNLPASQWTAAEYEDHLGDLYYSNTSGSGYRFQYDSTNQVYFWKLLEDAVATQALALAQTAKDTADRKRRVFLSQPTDTQAYDEGDLWVNATVSGIYKDGSSTENANNDLLRARVAKVSGVSFNPLHWQKASKYTDDTLAQGVANDLVAFQGSITALIDEWTDDSYISPQEKLALYNYFNAEIGAYNQLVDRYEHVYEEPSELEEYYEDFDAAYTNLERTIGYYVQPKITGRTYPDDTHIWSDTIPINNTDYPLQAHISAYISAKEDFEAALNNYANSLLEASIGNTKDSIAQKLGYDDYDDMVDKASHGEMIIDGGYIRTTLIDVENLITKTLHTSGTTASMSIEENEIKLYDNEYNTRVYIHGGDVANPKTGQTIYTTIEGSTSTRRMQSPVNYTRTIPVWATSNNDTISIGARTVNVRISGSVKNTEMIVGDFHETFPYSFVVLFNGTQQTVTGNLGDWVLIKGARFNVTNQVTLPAISNLSVPYSATSPTTLAFTYQVRSLYESDWTYYFDYLSITIEVSRYEISHYTEEGLPAQQTEIGKNGMLIWKDGTHYIRLGGTVTGNGGSYTPASDEGFEIRMGKFGIKIESKDTTEEGLKYWDNTQQLWKNIV